MIPSRLVLRNFLCYRECPPIDLEGVHLACLTGDNGNGKSALLDAITWALWGKARSNKDHELVSLGATEMEVELEFIAGEGRYRVIRKWRKVGRGGSPGLELQLKDGDTWRALTGSTIAETERAIHDLLKLSYETFINSSFLVQGKSGLFTSKTATERRAVLTEILDLGRYDGWEAQSRLLLREAHDRVTRRKDAIVTIESEARALAASVAELPWSTEAVAALQEQLIEAQVEQQHLAVAAQERQRHREARTEAQRAAAAAAERQAAARTGAAQQAPLVQGYEAMLARAPEIEAGYTELLAARERERQLGAERLRLDAEVRAVEGEAARLTAQHADLDGVARTLAAEIATLEGRLAEAERIRGQYGELAEARRVQAAQSPRALRLSELERQRAALEQAIAAARVQLTGRIDSLDRERPALAVLSGQLPERELRLATLAHDDEETAHLRRGILDAQQAERERREEAAALAAENQRLRAEMEALKARRDDLDQAVQHEQADCPLCRTPLGQAGLARVRAEYDAQGKELAGRFRANRPRIPELEANAQAMAERAKRLTQELERRTGARRQALGEAEAKLNEAQKAAERLAMLDAERAPLAAALAAKHYARAEQEQLRQTGAAIVALGFDAGQYAAALARVAELAHVEAEHQALTRAEASLEGVRQTLGHNARQREEVLHRLDRALTTVGELRAAMDALPLARAAAAVAELANYEGELARLQQARLGIEPARAALHAHQQAEQRAAEDLAGAGERCSAAERALAGLPVDDLAFIACQSRVTDLQGRLQTLQQELGRLKADVERHGTLLATLAGHRALLEEEQREAGIYSELAPAFGKRGVQGLLIETVLPEIEEAANELLARMTNNRMHLSLETQGVTQKGTTTETLEVKIADEWGTRPYEMFSGGEAFRIDLALRIALSKLLARRAGAPLATLVIDEGFGTQDAAGRERLVEAITAIQDHFQCLLVVTHISELKEQFETRIEVTKSGDGSIARVVTA